MGRVYSQVVSRSAVRSTTPEKSTSGPSSQQRSVDAGDGLAARSMSVPNNVSSIIPTSPPSPHPPLSHAVLEQSRDTE